MKLSWAMTNPFKGAALSDTDPSHYAVGVAVAHAGAVGESSAASGLTGWQRVTTDEGLYSGEKIS